MRSSASGKSAISSSSKTTTTTTLNRKQIREIADRLTKPVRHDYTEKDKKNDPTLEYFLLEEARECARKPFKSKPWAESNRASNDDEAKDSDATNSFIARMDGMERNRRQEMVYKSLKQEYDARLDRKMCPICESYQSYDEVINKRNKCSVCDVEFKPKLTWGQVSKNFTKRNKEYVQKSQDIKKKIIEDVQNEQKPKIHAFNPTTGKVEEIIAEPKKTRWNEDMEKQFFDRMEEKLEQRDEGLKKIEADSFGVQCTFRPHITKKHKVSGGDDDDDDEEGGELTEEDKAQAFLMRYDTDMDTRFKNHPEKYRQKVVVTKDTEDRPKWNVF